MWENLGPYFLGGGAALVVLAYFLLLIASFRTRLVWGLANLLVLPAPFFVFRHFRKALGAILVMLLGVAVAAAPFVINRFYHFSVDLGPLETNVNGELHITLTGWQPKGKDMDYLVLKQRPETVVLQMANPDVTDQTLEYLRGLKKLRVLDLSDTQVTDEGLQVLKEFSNLQVLYLNRTKITDDGVKQAIFPLQSLNELSVRNTSVTKMTREEWRAAKEGRKVTPVF
jgi:hypothetical protein